ncbi:hypothetical protein BDZ90DRAFT_262110 [Jaminaea rosea]|uniref:Uncharacterized protein n=1 Tax=Jaminaea rosea TaxID=1569628 RepID=A0A316UJQ6_9BASI|nr:hypothetical protein BDZ90DRAFT_262110 [Jaminaea rosea]PWN25459.1 hypothetical protein BDZ90DRAFT_262110 [Jaminaea rosea]
MLKALKPLVVPHVVVLLVGLVFLITAVTTHEAKEAGEIHYLGECYCWTKELKCSGEQTRTLYGSTLPGANEIGYCESVAPGHPVTKACVKPDCSADCDTMKVQAHACIDNTRAYRCLIFEDDGPPAKRLDGKDSAIDDEG